MRGTMYALAASLLAGAAQGHMIMKTPAPFGGASLDNSPLTSNYPCKVSGDPAAFFDRTTTKPTVMAVGAAQTLSFKGSAVHGGGSCQLAITADKAPSKASKWQVILSLEGGCPSKDGSGPSEYEFKIPDGVAPGEYVFAWTWISKLAGQPEYYMNCAPITVTGGSKKLKKRDAALPDLFVANLASVNSCKTSPGTDVLYPQPGPNVEKPGSKNNFAEISVKSGACTASGGGSDVPGSGSGGGGSDNGGGSPSNGGGNPSNGGGGNPGNGGGGNPGNGGGGNPGNGGGNGGGGSAPTLTTTPAAGPAVPTTLVSSTGTAPAAGPTGGDAAGGLGGACGEEGVFNCVRGTAYQQCASGRWTALQAMPAGTKCKVGQSATLWNRAEPRPRPVRRML